MISKIRKYFNLDKPFVLEYNDIRCFITIINVILIMLFGLSIAWFGLTIALIGMIKDITIDRKVNGLLMHFSNVILNLYFISLI